MTATDHNDELTTYYGLLRRIHAHLRPRRYLEIGVHKGHSLAFVQPGTEVVGVDPEPMLEQAPPAHTAIVADTSDAFFTDDRYGFLRREPFDLVFVDGLHLYEQALADVLQAERLCAPGAAILVHDCLPPDATTAARDRTGVVWAGDVWKAIVALQTHRPDLGVHVAQADPTGMGIVTDLDPSQPERPDWFDVAVDELVAVGFDDPVRGPGRFEPIDNRWSAIEAVLP
ncbi:MAG: class I SAM-dependent methyltransferase [Acidimicrobiia bacterium]|nr:class I SAM-dependent methyltransferase [Acidimicrobiia bacterium]